MLPVSKWLLSGPYFPHLEKRGFYPRKTLGIFQLIGPMISSVFIARATLHLSFLPNSPVYACFPGYLLIPYSVLAKVVLVWMINCMVTIYSIGKPSKQISIWFLKEFDMIGLEIKDEDKSKVIIFFKELLSKMAFSCLGVH